MNGVLTSAGIWMLPCLVICTLYSGTAVWLLLLGIAGTFALAGVATGVFEFSILSAVPARLLGLLDNDLLQALPLFIWVGFLLDRLKVIESVFLTFSYQLRHLGAAPALAALSVGLLTAPMNGSVASSTAVIGRSLEKPMRQLTAAHAITVLTLAGTIGVVFPPSLVLVLLGEAMMRAHTEALRIPGMMQSTVRTINTQDIFHAALLPSIAIFVIWVFIAAWQGRQTTQSVIQASKRQKTVAIVALALIGFLLYGVFTGAVRSVEAAACAAVCLSIMGVFSGTMQRLDWQDLMRDTLEFSGALMALLVGATVFSLVFRLFGTEAWIALTLASSPLPARQTAALVLVAVGLCAWALDAFEMIFVVIPIVAPPLIGLLQDAQQVAVLILLVLQASFLVPPMGYAVIVAHGTLDRNAKTIELLRAMGPYLVAQCMVIEFIFFYPSLVHRLDA